MVKETRNVITAEIKTFIDEYQRQSSVITSFGEPLVGFADAHGTYIQNLPSVIGPTHALPQQVLEDASIIISYYVPFTRELAALNSLPLRLSDSSQISGRYSGADFAHPDWARAYEELNAMFGVLNEHIVSLLGDSGFRGAVPTAASSFNRHALTSDWSQRHIAYAAGLGTFGVNNMLITEAGCCGRFSSVVTNIPLSEIAPGKPMDEELCLYKKNGSCGICVSMCPSRALQTDDAAFARKSCYQRCLENAVIYPSGCFDTEVLANASSDTTADDSLPTCSPASYSGSTGSEVCGKCVTGAPCAFLKG